MKRLLDLRLPDIYAKDRVLTDALSARHPTWDRLHLDMQLFGSKCRASNLATCIANGHDSRGGWEPPGDVIGVAGVSIHPESHWPDDCYKAAVDLTHVSGRIVRVEVGTYLTVADAWRLLDEAAADLKRKPKSAPPGGPE